MNECNIISNINIYIICSTLLYHFTQICQILITCKNFLFFLLTYNFDSGMFKMQKDKVRSEHCNMKKRKLRLKQEVRDVLSALLFYAVLVGGVIILNARFEYLNQVIK